MAGTHDVLLIWEEIPDKTEFYRIQATDEEFKKLKECHGRYVNGALDGDLEKWILAQLDTYGSPKGAWAESLLDSKYPVELESGVTVVLTGFIL